MNKLLILVFTTLACFGCGDEPIETFDFPENLEIDLNQDGIFDFQIIYQKLSVHAPIDPDPGPYELVRAKLVSLDSNQILKSEEATSILFLGNINLVKIEVNSPLFWESSTDNNSSIIVAISQNIYEDTWPEEWNINNEEIKDSYLLGFKIVNGTTPKIGVIEISIDTQSGRIEIVNIDFF